MGSQGIKTRLLVVLLCTLLCGVVGGLAGFLSGRGLALQTEERSMRAIADHRITAIVTFTKAYNHFAEIVHNNGLKPCSPEDLLFMRKLIFQSDIVKDGGRIEGGEVICSGIYGTEHLTGRLGQPDSTQLNGTRLYYNRPGFLINQQRSTLLVIKDVYAVINPFMMKEQGLWEGHMYFSVLDASTQQVKIIARDQNSGELPLFSDSGNRRINKSIYTASCSTLNHSCYALYKSYDEALADQTALLTVSSLAGGLTGATLGFLTLLFIFRHRSPESQLRRAISRNELKVVYQPLVEVKSRAIVAVEALARWTNDDGVAVRPDIFIAMAEERGFISEISRFVVRHSLETLRPALKEFPALRININISASDLEDASFIPFVEEMLQREGLRPESICFEITESVAVKQRLAIPTLHALRERGHHIAIDDFGTGYSSLAYLHDLCVDEIKIDRCFTMAIGTDAVTASVLPTIMEMARQLDLAVVIEGIETEVQAEFFQQYDRPIYAQGWLYGRPVTASVLLDRLRKSA